MTAHNPTLDPPPPIPPTVESSPRSASAGTVRDDTSISTLLKELRDETLTLFKQEAALIRTEVSEKVTQAGKDAAKIPAGALVAYLGIILMSVGLCLLGAIALLALGLESGLLALVISFVVIGLIVAIVGILLAKRGVSQLAHEDMTPHQSIASVKQTAQWAKEKAI